MGQHGSRARCARAAVASCGTEPNGADCLEALKNIGNYWIGDQPAGTQVSGWLDAWTPAPSAYVIKARNAADVAAGVSFARANNLRLVVKGGGHNYLGTSNAPGSLLIWTRAMKKVTLHAAFVGKDCEGRIAPVPAVSAEAGAVWMDLYDAVTTQGGRYVQGGSCTTVVDAFALVIIADGERPTYPGLARTPLDLAAAHKSAHDIDLAAAELRKIAPNGGSYVSESNYFNRAWQDAYWGKSYSRLRAIKTKYDPDGLFFVHYGVGSEEWSADGFTRLA